MGCFLGCFGRRKNRRRRQRRRESFQPRLNRISEESTKDVHLNLKLPIVEEVPKSAKDDDRLILKKVPTVVEVPKVSEGSAKDEEVAKISVIPITENICDKAEEIHSPSPNRKRVTFDSNVKTYEHVVVVEESIELLDEKEEEVRPLKPRQARCSSEGSDVTSDSSGSYPSNHRYQNCRESDDEEEEEDVTDCEESDLEDDEDEYCGVLLHEDFYNDDEICEDKLRNWDQEVYTEEIEDNDLDMERIGEKTSGCDVSARDRSGYVNAVLNPIENLSQWKAVKSKGRTTTTQTQPRKENKSLVSDQEHRLNASSFSLEEPHFSVKPKTRDETKKHSRIQEVAVDASLSTWLSTSQTSTTSGCSSSVSMGVETATSEKKYYSKPVQSHDERPVLCALTSDEIKQFSATNSPRKSPSRSPDSPIIGTVGGYWNSHSMATSK